MKASGTKVGRSAPHLLDARVAGVCLWILLAMTAVGAALALLYWRGATPTASSQPAMRNPLSLGPALKFGALLTLMLFISKATLAVFGRESVQWLAIVGLADADAILLPVTELHRQGLIATATAAAPVLLALAANAIMKSAIAAMGATGRFAVRVVTAFVCMFGAGAAAWLVQSAQL